MGDLDRFANLNFEDFRRFAADPTMSRYEKIGFPESYRAGHEGAIFLDIQSKLPALAQKGIRVLDIGPGCSDLPVLLMNQCETQGHDLYFIDSAEMLDQLPKQAGVKKISAQFPGQCDGFLTEHSGKFDVVLTYSVLHYVLPGSDVFAFIDAALSLLAPGGRLLVGDIPNVSKRKRFFASETGIRFHQAFTQTDETPMVQFNVGVPNQIDDAVVFSLLMRSRAAGFDAYVVPQASDLPMANRREDLLICRP